MTALGKGGREDEIGGVGVLRGYVTALRAHARREWMNRWRVSGGGWCGRGGHRGVGWGPAATGASAQRRRPGDQLAWPAQRIAQGSCGGGLGLERASERWPHTRPDELDSSGDSAAQGPRRGPCRLTARSCSGFQGPRPPVRQSPNRCCCGGAPAAVVVFAAAAGDARADGRRKRRNG